MKQIEEYVSKKIKMLRKEKNMTLKDLSLKTNLSISFLSQVERGISSMTLVSLRKIANAFEVPMNELVDIDESDAYINKTDAQILMRLGKEYKGFVRLSGKFSNRKLESLLLVMDPHFDNSEESAHEGEEFYYIVKGRALFILDDEEFYVNEGESIHYPSTVRHKVVNREDTELKMMCVITPPIF